MKKIVLVVAVMQILLAGNLFGQAPSWSWARAGNMGGPIVYNSDVLASTTDVYGNIYVTGEVDATAGAYCAFGNDTITTFNNAADFFIAKYDSAGNELWAYITGSNYHDFGVALAVDAQGNVYVTGYYQQPGIQFGATYLPNLSTGSSTTDIFLVKFSSSGNVLWAKRAGGLCEDYTNSLSIDSNGNIYLGGRFGSPSITFGNVTITGGGYFSILDGFIAKYDNAGSCNWAIRIGDGNHTYNTAINSIAFDNQNNVFVSGFFNDTVLHLGNFTLVNQSSPFTKYFIAKLNSNGTYTNAIMVNDTTLNTLRLTTDGVGNIYICGAFSNTILNLLGINLNNQNPGKYDAFIAKLNNSLGIQWAQETGGISYTSGIGVDAINNIYLSGSYDSPTMNFNGVNISKPFGDTTDMFVAKYTNQGNVVWALSAGGAGVDLSQTISSNNFGEVYIGGYFRASSIQFGNSVVVNTCNQNGNMFFAKLGQCSLAAPSVTPNGNVNLCPNQTITLTASGGTTYLWSNNATTASINVNTAGSYSVTGTAAGCSATSAPVVVTATPCPTPTGLSTNQITQHSGKCNWTGGVTCAIGYQIYYRRSQYTNWQYVNVASTQSQKVLYNLQNNYNVQWKIRTKCSATSYSAWSAMQTFHTLPRLEGDEPTTATTDELKITAYPNPTDGNVTVQLNIFSDESNVIVTNMLGQIVQQGTYQTSETNGEIQLNISDLPQGIYMVLVLDAEGKRCCKISKE